MMSKILKESEITAGISMAVPLICKTCKRSVRYSVSYSVSMSVFYLRCERCGADVAIFKGKELNKC